MTDDPPPGPDAIRAARASWRRAQIVAAATALMREDGFYKTTVEALARRAGVSVGTVYQYVSSKEDILLLVLLDALDAYERQVPAAMAGIEDPILRLAAGFVRYCEAIDEHRSSVLMAYRETHALDAPALEQIKARDARTIELFAPAVRDAAAAGLINAAVRPELLAFDLVLLGQMWALKHWHLATAGTTVQTYAREQLALVLDGALDRRARSRRAYGALLSPAAATP